MSRLVPGRPTTPRLRECAHWGAGAVLAVLFVLAVVLDAPDRGAIARQNFGVRELLAGHYADAEWTFVDVIRREPRATSARLGLACAFYLTGHKSRAAMTLTVALNQGLVLSRSTCGHGVNLARRFIAAKLGILASFAVPRDESDRRFWRRLSSPPKETTADDAERLLIGSCLAFRSQLDAAGWYYAADAHDRQHGIARPQATLFLRCLGDRTRSRLGCETSTTLDQCIFVDRRRRAFLEERPYVFPSDDPVAFRTR